MYHAKITKEVIQAYVQREARKIRSASSRYWDQKQLGKVRTVPVGVCQKNILCECSRRSCPGRTLTSMVYIRRIANS